MSLSLLAPAYLWALLAIPLVWFLPRGKPNPRHAALRSLVLLLLVIGVSRPVLRSLDERQHHVLVLDRSESVADADLPAVDDAFRRLVRGLPATARTTLIVLEPDRRQLATDDLVIEEIVRLTAERSSLATALQIGARAIPEGASGAVTILSDGLATDRHWGDAMAELTERGIPLHTVSCEPSPGSPRPVSLTLPDTMRVGHTATARVRLVGDGATVRVVLRDGETVLASRDDVVLTGFATIALAFEPVVSGFRDYELAIEVTGGSDARTDDDRLSRLVAIQDPLKVLYLGQRVEGSGPAIEKLLGAGFDVDVRDTGGAPPMDERHQVIMLDDRPASALPDTWQQFIAEGVNRRGVGLLASGGRAAFGPGGYSKTPIEDLLPVELLQKEEKKDPSTALAIIIDTSGSMVGNRMTIAKQVARLAMRRLQPHDKVGIVEFYGTKQWAAPLQSAANQIDLQRALNRLGAEGGTVLLPAIEESYYALKNVQTRYKHVLILTDAGVETGPYESLLRRMSDEGMTVSTVLVGPGRHSEFLVELADWGKGRYYNASDRFNLPELLLKKPSTSVLPAYRPERVELEARSGAGWWGGIDSAALPPLDGFVESELRPGAELLISTSETEKPILASWVKGLGRVTALLTEPTGPGTSSWSEWDDYGALLGRILTRTARGAQEPFAFRLDRRGEVVHLDVERLVRVPLAPELAHVSENGDAEEALALRETAPGRWRVTFAWPEARPLRIAASSATMPAYGHRLASGAGAGTAPELQVDPGNGFPMAEAASVTGGQAFAVSETALRAPVSTGDAPVRLAPVWPWFLLIALLVYVAEVYLRRRVGSFLEVN